MWSDIRTDTIVDQIIAKFPDKSKNHLKPLCGLPVSPYFSALKIRWLKQNVSTVRKAIRDKRCKVGTLDTWIIWVILFYFKKFYYDFFFPIVIINLFIELDWRQRKWPLYYRCHQRFKNNVDEYRNVKLGSYFMQIF